MSNYVISSNKCLIPVENAVSEMIAAFVNDDIDVTTDLTTIFTGASNGITMYRVVGNSDTSIYPVVVDEVSRSNDAAIVTVVSLGGAGMFIFEYAGEMYINHIYGDYSGIHLSGWYQVTTTAVSVSNNE